QRPPARDVVAPDPGETGTPGGAQPFLPARGEQIDTGRARVQRYHAGRLDRIDDVQDAAPLADRTETREIGVPPGRELDSREREERDVIAIDALEKRSLVGTAERIARHDLDAEPQAFQLEPGVDVGGELAITRGDRGPVVAFGAPL